MHFLPLRLSPGVDLRCSLEEIAAKNQTDSAFVIAGVGSLAKAMLRYAGETVESEVSGPLEILSLSGTISAAGAHLHASVSDAHGRVYGGHLCYGCMVRTTAEVLLAPLKDWSLSREHDQATGYKELVVRRRD